MTRAAVHFILTGHRCGDRSSDDVRAVVIEFWSQRDFQLPSALKCVESALRTKGKTLAGQLQSDEEVLQIRPRHWRDGHIHPMDDVDALRIVAPYFNDFPPPNHPFPWMFTKETKSARRRKGKKKGGRAVTGNANSDGTEEALCVICMEKRASYAFAPCGHLSTCKGCSDQIMSTSMTCPICRCKTTSSLSIFFVSS